MFDIQTVTVDMESGKLNIILFEGRKYGALSPLTETEGALGI
jgi:hypothetical protein